jgi:hypothetical protein
MSEAPAGIPVRLPVRLIAVECHPGEEEPCRAHLPASLREARILPVRGVPSGYASLSFSRDTVAGAPAFWREFWRFQDLKRVFNDHED